MDTAAVDDAVGTAVTANDCRRDAVADAAAGLLFEETFWALDARTDDVAAGRPAALPDSAPRDVAAVRGDSASPASAEALAASPTATADPMPSATANAPMRPTWLLMLAA